MVSAIDDPFSIWRIERPAVISQLMRELLNVLAIRVHRVNIQVAVAQGSEDNLLAVLRNGRLGVIAWSGRQLLKIRAIGIRRKNVVAGINRPDVAFGEIRT